MPERALRRIAALFLLCLGVSLPLAEAWAEARHVLKGRIIRSLAVEAGDAGHILVGQKGGKPGSGLVFQSLDGGQNWRTLNGNRPLSPEATDVQAVLAVSKELLFAGTWKHGLFISEDGGRSFAKAQDFPNNDVRDLQIAGDVIYAATGNQGVMASKDFGKSWEALGPGNDFLWSLTAAKGALFASSPAAGVFALAGGSWQKVFAADKAYSLAADPDGAGVQAVAGETGLYATAGNGWQNLMPGKFADVLILDEARILAASWSDGISVLTPAGETEFRLLEGTAVVHLHPTGDHLLAGTWGKGLHILPMATVLRP